MFDVDRAREKLESDLAPLAALPDIFAITRLELEGSGRIARFWGEKMIPLSLLPLLKGKVDLLTDEGAYSFLLPAYLSAGHSLKFDESVFQDVVSQIVEFRSSRCYRLSTVAFLFGCNVPKEFQCESLLISLPDAHYFEVLYNTWGPLKRGPLVPFALENPDVIKLLGGAVMIRHVTSAPSVDEVPSIVNEVSTLLKAIALRHGVTKSLVLSPILTLSDLTMPGVASRVSYIHGFDLSLSHNIKPFILDVESVCALYSELSRCDQSSFLAPDKILSAMTRKNPSDKFIDLITTLESCFIKISHEARYRLALSCAAVLNHSFTVYKDMLYLYKVRSDLIHGKIKLCDVQENLVKLESYTIPVVRYFLTELAQGNTLEDANEKVDHLLLPNS